ncbi:MAG: nuclear transport factor 2 family protein [Bacteroidales bacterium]
MKKNILFLFLIFLSFSLYAQDSMENDIDNFLTSWHEAAALGNQASYFEMIDESGIYIGTDSTEIWTKQEFYDWSTPHFSAGKTWNFKANSRNIYISDDKQMAWFDELINFSKGTLRGSGILIKRQKDWKILHYVLSLPVPNEKFEEVMEVINSE